MPEYLSPGVYVEEVDRGPKPIEGVGTAMAAFVGFSEKAEWVREVDGELVTENLLNKPQLVTNWPQYVQKFGGFVQGSYLPHAVYGYFNNGGSRCYVLSVKTIGRAQAPLLGADGPICWPSPGPLVLMAFVCGSESKFPNCRPPKPHLLPNPKPKSLRKAMPQTLRWLTSRAPSPCLSNARAAAVAG
jgi:hypothetical protein